jgi:hypothetical protein
VTPKDVLDLEQTAKYLGMDESSLRALAAERRIPCLAGENGSWVFSKKSLDKWRSQQTLRA